MKKLLSIFAIGITMVSCVKQPLKEPLRTSKPSRFIEQQVLFGSERIIAIKWYNHINANTVEYAIVNKNGDTVKPTPIKIVENFYSIKDNGKRIFYKLDTTYSIYMKSLGGVNLYITDETDSNLLVSKTFTTQEKLPSNQWVIWTKDTLNYKIK